MWIVRIALNRPYTFIVLALLILILSPIIIFRTPTDIFPNINIPVIAVSWTYTGLSPEEMEGRITTVYERVLTTTVDNIQHIESTTVNGTAIVKVFLQPNASIDRANAQVTAVSQTILRQLPPGSLPPLILNYSASTVPILQLGLSGKNLTEPQLNDIALNFLRTQLVTVPGASVPFPFGGKQRQVMVNLNQGLLQAKGLSPNDVLTVLGTQNLILPGGTVKMGQFEYDVDLNADVKTVQELNDLPIKTVGSSTIYLRDVATVSDGFAPQTNIVRQDGRRGVLVTVLKAGDASTIDVVKGVRQILPRVAQTLPPNLKIQPLSDQSIFVRASINGVIREAILAAALTGLMILIFLGSWRSTLIIAISIPLSILTSVIVLSFLHQTINIMTLGGLALAVGILVDDATVTIENIERHLEEGAELHDGILEGAAQIAVPALVSTLCICIVFLPMFFLSGVARYLFVPLAEAVIFAMLASYILSRTLVPTMAMYLLKAKQHGGPQSRNPFAIFQRGFERVFERVRVAYASLLAWLVSLRMVFVPGFLAVCVSAFVLIPFLGQDFFPDTDSGQFILHVRAKTGTRIEETARLADQVETSVRQMIPPSRGRQHSRQHRPAFQQHQLHLQQHGVNGRGGRGHTGLAEREASSDGRLCAPASRAAPPRISWSYVLFSSGRHRHADAELWSSGAHRCSDRWSGYRGECTRRGQDAYGIEACPRHYRSAHPAAGRLSEVSRGGRSHQGGAGRVYGTRHCQQPLDLAQRQLPGDTHVLSQPEERRLL